MSAGAAAGLALLLVVAALAPKPAGSTESRHLVLEYEVYFSGFRTVSVVYDVRLDAAAYEVNVSLGGRGILNWWFAWTMQAFSQGRLKDEGVVPVRAGADSVWKGKHRRTRIFFPPFGPPAVELDPPPAEGDADLVEPALREGARDLAGALYAVLARVGAQDSCDGREAVFDGRRRFDLVLTHGGRDDLAYSPYSAWSGEALRCTLQIDRIAGYSDERSRSGWRGDEKAKLWLAPAFDGLPPVPVRLELDARVGSLRAHLTQATLTAGGEVQRLAQMR